MVTCGEIDFNQLCETYTTCLIPSEVTSNILGSISVVNMIELLDEKIKKIFPGIPGESR